MNRDPCMFPQLRSKKRERDDWFLIQIGCFNSDTENEKSSGGSTKDSPLGFDDDEAADYQDRVDEAMKEARDRGDDTDEIEDYFDRTVVREPLMSPADRTQRDPIDIAKIAGIREFSPTQFPSADTPGGPVSQPEPERVPGKKGTVTVAGAPFVSGGRSSELAYQQALGKAIGRTPRIDREGRLDPGALFGDPATDIFESDLIEQSRQAAQAQGMTQYGFNPAEQVVEGTRSQVYNVAGPSAMTMQGVGAAGPSEPYLSEDVINEIKKQAQEPPREEGLGALLSPGGIIKNLVGDLTNRDAAFAREVTRPGNVFQRNDQGDITGVYNPKSNAVFTPESVGIFDIKGQEAAAGDLYKLQRQRRDEDREARNQEDDPTPIIPPLITESAIAEPQQPDVGQNVISEANYQPRDPVQYAYTGLPTLAPVSLQPSFRAPQQFSPAYGLSTLRRS